MLSFGDLRSTGYEHDSQPPAFRIEVARDGLRDMLAVHGELDYASAPALEARVRRVCASGTAGLLLDLRRLQFIDSSGLNALLRTKALCEEHGCALQIVPTESSASRVFELTRLVDRLPFRQATHEGT